MLFLLAPSIIRFSKIFVKKKRDPAQNPAGLRQTSEVITMNKIAFLYSGQGAQFPGMGRDLYEAFPAVRALHEEASSLLGYDTAAKSFTDSPDFNDTLFAQPLNFILQHALTLLLEEAAAPAGLAGHSLGEYAALCAGGAFSFSQGLSLLSSRARHMQQAAEEHPGAMFAILKLSPAQVEAACEETEGYVKAVNYNSPLQTVIAGEATAAQAAAERCKAQGARVAPLAVNAAFHSALMQDAAEGFYADIQDAPFSAPSIPFYSNLTGGRMTDFSDLPSYLKNHLISPVRFTDQLAALQADGYDVFVELGPGKTLQGLVKKTLENVTVLGVQGIPTLEKARETLAALEKE